MSESYFYNLIFSIGLLCKTVLNKHRVYKSYVVDVFIKTDVLFNAISGGSPHVTVSARVGKYASLAKHKRIKFSLFWIVMQWLIDKTFESVDGKYHCKQNVYDTLRTLRRLGLSNDHLTQGNKLLFIPLLVISLGFCIPIYFILIVLTKNKINIKG